jgi:nickel/cobalt transporter (NicO) family protein
VEQQGARCLYGRDLRLELELTPAALERDRAAARIEPWLGATARTIDAVKQGMVKELEAELDALAFRETRLGGDPGAGVGGLAPMIAQMAPDRVLDADSGATVGAPGPAATTTAAPFDGPADSRRMIDAFNQPFSLLVLLTFFAWGAMHAVLPGHGKTMVAAYLLGTRGRIADALRLGGIVTFTHTFALYTAGLAIVWVVETYGSAQGQSFHERLVRHVSLLSGVGLIAYGVFLAMWRLQAIYAARPGHSHAHGHTHTHPDGTSHAHEHGHGPGHEHGHGVATHDHAHDHGHAHTHADGTTHAHEHGHGPGHEHAATHDHAHDHGHAHTHADGTTHGHGLVHPHDHAGLSAEEHAKAHADEAASVTSWRDLLILGISGGIVPCPAGVTLVLYSLTFRSENTKKAFAYLTSFSLGLGSVLVAIALAMVLSRTYLLRADGKDGLARSRAFVWLPVVTAALISLVGVAVCWEAFDPGYAWLKARF